MDNSKRLRVLMYSHSSSSAESAGSTVAITAHLSKEYPGSSFLVLTDLPVFGRFRLPPNLDYIHLPRLSNWRNGSGRQNGSFKLKDTVRAVRRSTILATVRSFAPHLLVVDEAPLGQGDELQDALVYLRKNRPGTKSVLGLGEKSAGTTGTKRAAWKNNGSYETIRSLYDEVWFYVTPKVPDHVQESNVPPADMTGYEPRLMIRTEGTG